MVAGRGEPGPRPGHRDDPPPGRLPGRSIHEGHVHPPRREPGDRRPALAAGRPLPRGVGTSQDVPVSRAARRGSVSFVVLAALLAWGGAAKAAPALRTSGTVQGKL